MHHSLTIRLIFFLDNWQAYAELETDTPGTVHGVTNTKDGKSAKRANEPQGEYDHTYKEHNRNEEDGYRQLKEFDFHDKQIALVGVITFFIMYWILRKPNMSLSDQIAEEQNVRTRPKYDNDNFKDT